MNSARVRGQRRIAQATGVLAASAAVLTAGSMALAYADVRAAAATSSSGSETSPTDTLSTDTSSTDTSSTGDSSTGDSSTSSSSGTSLGTGSGPSSARSAGS